MNWEQIILGALGGIGGCTVVEVLWVKFRHEHHHHEPALCLFIIGATNMATVGQPFLFTVVATKAGVQVPDTNITASSDNGTATVNPDGTGGTCTPVNAGSMTITATDGTLTAAPLVVTVVADQTPDTLTIIPS